MLALAPEDVLLIKPTHKYGVRFANTAAVGAPASSDCRIMIPNSPAGYSHPVVSTVPARCTVIDPSPANGRNIPLKLSPVPPKVPSLPQIVKLRLPSSTV